MESLAAAYVEHDVEKFVPNPRESKVPNVKKKQREERVPDRADECTDTAFKGPFGRMNTSVNQGGSISEEMLRCFLSCQSRGLHWRCGGRQRVLDWLLAGLPLRRSPSSF